MFFPSPLYLLIAVQYRCSTAAAVQCGMVESTRLSESARSVKIQPGCGTSVAHLCLRKGLHPLDGLFGAVQLTHLMWLHCQWKCVLFWSRLIQSRPLDRRRAAKRSESRVTESRGQLKPAAAGLPEVRAQHRSDSCCCPTCCSLEDLYERVQVYVQLIRELSE